jgi:hypothetical protein
MRLYKVTDPVFRKYGAVVDGYDLGELLSVLKEKTPQSETGTEYVPEDENLMALPVARDFRDRAYGGMPVQLGWCNGCNTKLNALEYHRDSEFNVGTEDFILLLASREDIERGVLDTKKVKAFLCPKGVLVEIYSTTLHYAPCSTAEGKGFRVCVVLPKGTNLEKPLIEVKNYEDSLLRASNKWLLAHPDSAEAASGAIVALDGENIDVSELWK